MDAKLKQLLDAVARDLAIQKWSGEDENHWAERCLYSAAGRTTLHILWDDERPDSFVKKGDAVEPPVDGSDAPGIGSVSFFHFWKSMDRFLVPVSRLFGKTFGAYGQIGQHVWDEEIAKMRQADEPDWGVELDFNDSRSKDFLERLKKYVSSLYLDTGFIRHRPMRVGPVADRAASLGNILFLRGSWLDAANVHMSGLAMWSTETHEAASIPFDDLLLLPLKRTGENKVSDPRVNQTITNLLSGSLASIEFSKMGSANDGVVQFTVPFELPFEEKNLLLLCSWPKDFGNLGSMEDRSCSMSVFDGLRSEMEKLGYNFCERKDVEK